MKLGDARKLPTVEVLGPWLKNSGDVLNLWSVAERLDGRAQLAVSSRLGVEVLPEEPRLLRVKWQPDWPTLRKAVRSGSLSRVGFVFRDMAALTLAPRRLLEREGIVPGRHIQALLDCSGFAYGDPWPTRRMDERERYYRRLQAQGTVVVLLPQALGPFEDPRVRASSARLFEQCDLIYPRDEHSLGYVRALGFDEKMTGVAPDITHLVRGVRPADEEVWRGRVCIIPNARMLDKTRSSTSVGYLDFMVRAIDAVRIRGLEPCLLVHERNDIELAERLRARAGIALPIVNEDARVSKGLLGACCAVIGSRYHALLSALSQGVPALATSWSHKYDALFDDYGCGEYILDPAAPEGEVDPVFDRFLAPVERQRLASRLVERAEAKKAEVRRMWEEVESRTGVTGRGERVRR